MNKANNVNKNRVDIKNKKKDVKYKYDPFSINAHNAHNSLVLAREVLKGVRKDSIEIIGKTKKIKTDNNVSFESNKDSKLFEIPEIPVRSERLISLYDIFNNSFNKLESGFENKKLEIKEILNKYSINSINNLVELENKNSEKEKFNKIVNEISEKLELYLDDISKDVNNTSHTTFLTDLNQYVASLDDVKVNQFPLYAKVNLDPINEEELDDSNVNMINELAFSNTTKHQLNIESYYSSNCLIFDKQQSITQMPNNENNTGITDNNSSNSIKSRELQIFKIKESNPNPDSNFMGEKYLDGVNKIITQKIQSNNALIDMKINDLIKKITRSYINTNKEIQFKADILSFQYKSNLEKLNDLKNNPIRYLTLDRLRKICKKLKDNDSIKKNKVFLDGIKKLLDVKEITTDNFLSAQSIIELFNNEVEQRKKDLQYEKNNLEKSLKKIEKNLKEFDLFIEGLIEKKRDYLDDLDLDDPDEFSDALFNLKRDFFIYFSKLENENNSQLKKYKLKIFKIIKNKCNNYEEFILALKELINNATIDYNRYVEEIQFKAGILTYQCKLNSEEFNDLKNNKMKKNNDIDLCELAHEFEQCQLTLYADKKIEEDFKCNMPKFIFFTEVLIGLHKDSCRGFYEENSKKNFQPSVYNWNFIMNKINNECVDFRNENINLLKDKLSQNLTLEEINILTSYFIKEIKKNSVKYPMLNMLANKVDESNNEYPFSSELFKADCSKKYNTSHIFDEIVLEKMEDKDFECDFENPNYFKDTERDISNETYARDLDNDKKIFELSQKKRYSYATNVIGFLRDLVSEEGIKTFLKGKSELDENTCRSSIWDEMSSKDQDTNSATSSFVKQKLKAKLGAAKNVLQEGQDTNSATSSFVKEKLKAKLGAAKNVLQDGTLDYLIQLSVDNSVKEYVKNKIEEKVSSNVSKVVEKNKKSNINNLVEIKEKIKDDNINENSMEYSNNQNKIDIEDTQEDTNAIKIDQLVSQLNGKTGSNEKLMSIAILQDTSGVFNNKGNKLISCILDNNNNNDKIENSYFKTEEESKSENIFTYFTRKNSFTVENNKITYNGKKKVTLTEAGKKYLVDLLQEINKNTN